MPQQAWRHRIAAATRWTHRRDELRVDEKYFARVLQVVPVSMVKELPQQFNRRLSAVYLSRRHVHVVDENDRLLARRRSEVALLSTIHLRHYQELHTQYIRTLKKSCTEELDCGTDDHTESEMVTSQRGAELDYKSCMRQNQM